MQTKNPFTRFAVARPWLALLIILAISIGLGAGLKNIEIDTDPEHMLSEDTPVRVELNRIEERFGIKDILVLGLQRKNGGLWTAEGMNEVREITDRILDLPGIDTGEKFQSLNTIDNVSLDQDGIMVVRAFLNKPLETDARAKEIKQELQSNRILNQKLISKDGSMVAVYIPINNKDDAAGLYDTIMGTDQTAGIVEEVAPGKYNAWLAGVPVAQSVFGREMFAQMGVLAPLVGLIIFVTLLVMFRKVQVVLAPLGVAMIAVLWTMGLMVWLGFPVHIMSSMAPVFLMTIGVSASIHLLSQFYDTCPLYPDRKSAVVGTMRELQIPILFTTLTTALGFLSLAMVDIPPVRIFGSFVAFGVVASWVLTVTMIPAILILVKKIPLAEVKQFEEEENDTFMNKVLQAMGDRAIKRKYVVIVASIGLVAFGVLGVMRLEVNDNPVRWFKASSDIRQANEVLNEEFGGTYLSYIEVDAGEKDGIKRPEVLQYMQRLQEHLEESPLVGKTTSLADIVRRVHRVIVDDRPESEIIPDDKLMVGELLFAYQSSGAGPDSLDNLTDNGFQAANIWVQMNTGDNKNMAAIADRFESWTKANPAPAGVELTLSGPNYLNMVWQWIMVNGMMKALIGSFVMVLILLVFQFRSVFWGILGILPLMLTILLSYGMLGWMGRNYDMPVAVLSALTLGMAIDFAIHFIQRFRERLKKEGEWETALRWTMGEPARGIMRNAFILLVGFSVMFFAELVPYITVGFFMASIMLLSSLVTLVLLPALIATLHNVILKRELKNAAAEAGKEPAAA